MGNIPVHLAGASLRHWLPHHPHCVGKWWLVSRANHLLLPKAMGHAAQVGRSISQSQPHNSSRVRPLCIKIQEIMGGGNANSYTELKIFDVKYTHPGQSSGIDAVTELYD